MDNSNHDEQNRSGLSRRGFVETALLTVPVAANAQTPRQELTDDGMVKVTLNVNGQEHALMVEPRLTLLQTLRDKLGLTGTKLGCERGECGACTVLIDGVARYSCLTLAVEAAGAKITTLEGLMNGDRLGPVQQAFLEKDGYQCGYCTPGQIVAVEALLRKTPQPTTEQIRDGVSGNLCRCGAYAHIFQAAQRAAELKKA